ncbi:MAG: tetratricopeptide repeat protein [Candidatus Limimorpha sp.]
MNCKLFIFSIIMTGAFVCTAQNASPCDTAYIIDLHKNAELFSKGIEEKYKENDTEAIKNFEEALKYYPEDDASMYELSALYLNDPKKIADAFNMIEQATKLKPENKWYKLRLARFYTQDQNFQAAKDIYEELFEKDPGNLEYFEYYIEILLNTREYDKALDVLNTIEGQIGQNEYISLQRIDIYTEQNNETKIFEEFEKLIEIAPENTRYASMLAVMYKKANRNEDAFRIYQKIKEIEPENENINISLMEYYLDTNQNDKAFNEFIEALKNKNLDYAIKVNIYNIWFERKDQTDKKVQNEAQKAGEIFLEVYPEQSMGYFILGSIYQTLSDFTKAKDYYEKALERDKKNLEVYFNLCLTDISLDQYSDLIAHSDAAIQCNQLIPVFYLFKGIGCIKTKDYEQAITTLEKGRKISTTKELSRDFNIYLGDSYHYLNNKKEMYKAYDRALAIEPDNIYLLNNYAYFLSLDNKDLDKALEMSEKTIQQEPKNPTYLDTYAWVLYKMGRYSEAKKFMKKVFKYEKKPQGTNYEHRGDILFKLGDTKEAVKNWEKAKKFDDASEFIDKKIAEQKLYE